MFKFEPRRGVAKGSGVDPQAQFRRSADPELFDRFEVSRKEARISRQAALRQCIRYALDHTDAEQ